MRYGGGCSVKGERGRLVAICYAIGRVNSESAGYLILTTEESWIKFWLPNTFWLGYAYIYP